MLEKFRENNYQNLVASIFLTLVVFGLYHGSLQNDFVYDDDFQIKSNPQIRSLSSIPSIFTSGVWDLFEYTDEKYMPYYRPIMMTVFALEYHFFGLNPWPYHFLNILLHISMVLTIFCFLRFFLEKFRSSGKSSLDSRKIWQISFWTAFLFAIHPINSQAVNFIAAFTEILYAILLLWSMIFYFSKTKNGRFISLLLFFLALLTKETALIFPFMIWSHKFFFEIKPKISLQKKIRHIIKQDYILLIPIIIYFILSLNAVDSATKLIITIKHLSLLLLTPTIFWINIWHLLYPFNLNLFYLFKFDWILLIPFSVTLFVIEFAWITKFYKKINIKEKSLWIFSGIIFIIPLIPTTNRAMDVVRLADRYLYLPCVGFFLLIIYGAMHLHIFLQKKSWGDVFFRTFSLGIIVILVTLSLNQNKSWRNDEAIFLKSVEKNAESGRAQLIRLSILCNQKDFNCAEESERWKNLIMDDIDVNSQDKITYPDSLLFMHMKSNKDYAGAKTIFNRLIEAKIGPKTKAGNYLEMGLADYKNSRLDLAENNLKSSLELFPESRTSNFFLGALACENGDIQTAEKFFDASIRFGNPQETVGQVRKLCPKKKMGEYENLIDFQLMEPLISSWPNSVD